MTMYMLFIKKKKNPTEHLLCARHIIRGTGDITMSKRDKVPEFTELRESKRGDNQ